MIAIIGAMQAEVEGLLREMQDLQEEEILGHSYYSGRLGSHDVAVTRCGVGKVNAAICAQTMLLRFRPEVVINTGVGGSLSPQLDILDVAVATGFNSRQHFFRVFSAVTGMSPQQFRKEHRARSLPQTFLFDNAVDHSYSELDRRRAKPQSQITVN